MGERGLKIGTAVVLASECHKFKSHKLSLYFTVLVAINLFTWLYLTLVNKNFKFIDRRMSE